MRTGLKYFVMMIITFALVLAIPAVFTQEANAAAKKSGPRKVTVHVVTDESVSRAVSNSLQYVTYTKSTYNKKGFRTKYVSSNNKGSMEKVKIKYNSKGYMTSCKVYNKSNKLYRLIKVRTKKGLPYTSKEYSVNGRKKALIYKQTYVYKGKKLVKIKWTNLTTNTSGTENVAASGALGKKGSPNAKYDTYGNLTEDTITTKQTVSGTAVTIIYRVTHEYTYDMVGNMTEDICVETTTQVRPGGKKSEVVTKTVKKFKYKKMKVLKKYLEQILYGRKPVHH